MPSDIMPGMGAHISRDNMRPTSLGIWSRGGGGKSILGGLLIS